MTTFVDTNVLCYIDWQQCDEIFCRPSIQNTRFPELWLLRVSLFDCDGVKIKSQEVFSSCWGNSGTVSLSCCDACLQLLFILKVLRCVWCSPALLPPRRRGGAASGCGSHINSCLTLIGISAAVRLWPASCVYSLVTWKQILSRASHFCSCDQSVCGTSRCGARSMSNTC